MLPGIEFVENARLPHADAAVVATEWDEFRPDLVRVKAALASLIIVDMRNIGPIKTMKALGLYVSVGRGFNGEG
jgi:hypothetical protein